MGQLVPADDLPGGAVVENDLPTAGVTENDLFKAGQPGVPAENPPVPGGAAPAFYPTGPGIPGVGQFARDVGTMAQPIGQFAKSYASKPGLAVADLVAGSMLGAPPKATVEGAQALGETYKNVRDYLSKTGKVVPPAGAPAAPAAQAGVVADELANAAKISRAIGPEGLAAGMKAGGAFPPAAPPIGGPAAQQGAKFIESITAKFASMAQAVAPVLNTVGRVAGPLGTAYNVYEAGKFAHDAELGKKLAEGQGRVAQNVFRQNNTQYGAPVTRDQARAVLQSGSERDIYAFGGREKLQAIAGQ